MSFIQRISTVIFCSILFSVPAFAAQIACQDTLTDSKIDLLFQMTENEISDVKLIANGGEFTVDSIQIEKSEYGYKEIMVSAQEGTVNFDYIFKNLDTEKCFGSKKTDDTNKTHIEVVAWQTVISWLPCQCVK